MKGFPERRKIRRSKEDWRLPEINQILNKFFN
jgi:hypothetical protein